MVKVSLNGKMFSRKSKMISLDGKKFSLNGKQSSFHSKSFPSVVKSDLYERLRELCTKVPFRTKSKQVILTICEFFHI